MEIISKSRRHKRNNSRELEINNIFTEYNYKYIFDIKMNKIKEEIRDYIIDKYTKKIIEQNKKIINIKNQLDNITKKYLDMIKLIIDKYNINTLDNNYINNYKNLNIYISNSTKEENKINIENKIEHKKNKIKYYPNNLEKNKIFNINKNNINENKENKKYNFNLNNNNINYLKELNKKDLKKINNIQNQLNITKTSKKKFKTKKLNSVKNKNINRNEYNSFYNKFDKNLTNTLKINNKRNKLNENYSNNFLSFNNEENEFKNKKNLKKPSININTKLNNIFFKELKTDKSNNTFLNTSLEYNKNNSNEINNNINIINNYNNKNNKYKIFFYKFKNINNTLNDSFKQNASSEKNIFKKKIKPEYICNPVINSFLNKI